jgi:hypothetical protein
LEETGSFSQDEDDAKNSHVYIEYGHFKRLFCIICFLFVIFAGVFFIYVSTYISILFGVILIFVSLVNIIDIAFFKALIMDESCLGKEWYFFGKQKISLSNLSARCTNRLWEGLIIFRDKNRSRLQMFYMNFETFPSKDRGYERIKEALIKNGIIKGDEVCWNQKGVKKQKWWQKAFARIKSKK